MFNLRFRARVWVFVRLAACAVFLAGTNPQVGEARPLLATSPSLGTANTLAILAHTTITDVPTSKVIGNVGSDGGGAGIGLTCAEVIGTVYSTDAAGPAPCTVALSTIPTTAQTDWVTAFNALNSGANADANCISPYVFGTGNKDLAGATLVPGVYCADTFSLTGTLTLSGSGVWVFKSAASLITTGTTAKVVGGDPCNVWWRVGSQATLSASTSFKGNILANTSITLQSGASLDGRALAHTGQVSLSANRVNASMCQGVPTTVSSGKSFSPATIPAGGVSTLTITLSNTYSTTTTLTKPFTDTLPSGMVIAPTPNVATTCGGSPALTANPGGSLVAMAAGGTILAHSSCTLKVDVTSARLAGSCVNTVSAGALSTSNGDDNLGASATAICSAASSQAAPASQPREVPEGDTLLLFGGGIGGLATWLGWQWRKVRTRSKQ